MALTYDQISGITQRKFIPKLYDNIFNSNPLLQRHRKRSYELVDGGISIMVPLNYAVPTASGWYFGADTLNVNDNDQITAAEYTWKALYTNISILRTDELKNAGDEQMVSLVKSKVKIAEKQMEDQLGTGIFSNATNAKSIVGLQQIVATSNTIGGISQSSFSWWGAGSVDSTTTTLSLSAMQTVWNLCTIGSWSPTVAVTTRSIFNSYYALLQPQQRFQDSESASGGFQSLLFNGLPILPDSHCPSSNLFFLNEDYMHLWAHKDEDMRFEPFAKPINQNVKVAKIYWMGAYGTSNARLQGALTGITN
jgi:hypothetical protein